MEICTQCKQKAEMKPDQWVCDYCEAKAEQIVREHRVMW